MSRKRRCGYCPREIDVRGYPSHVHFNHRGEALREFRRKVEPFLIELRIREGLLLPAHKENA